MIKITISTLKGGSGKTTLSILIANNLAARGQKVLVIDLDPNNSSSLYYLSGIKGIEDVIVEKNIFAALTKRDAAANIVATKKDRVDIIPSSLELSSIRTIDTKTLSKVLAQVDNDYDYIIIDTAPTYDNHTISALYAADLIFTPVETIKFCLTTTAFMQAKLYDELQEKINSWYLIYNKWDISYEKFENSRQSQFSRMFESSFENFLTVKIPKTPLIDNYINSDEPLSVKSRAIGNKRMATAINTLIDLIDVNHTTTSVEEF